MNVLWYCFCDKLILNQNLLLLFHTKMVSTFLWENVLHREALQINAKNSNFEIFESAL